MTSRPAPFRSIQAVFADPILDQIPRLLTQVDRNPHSPTYGCCCRNHWHYRIEDIANSQMQELVLTLALAWKMDLPKSCYYDSDLLLEWIEAILAYTVQIQRPSGCFDEVYQGQDSYAATAFVTFYTSETVLQMGSKLTPSLRRELDSMFYHAAVWLGRTTEDLAGNQVAGAAAAFMNLKALDPGRGYEEGFEDLLDVLQSIQTEKGWFPEYGGADIGYASLTHSYLALIAHRTKDIRARSMADASADFLEHFLHRDGTTGGVYGSRNTAYFIPLGAVLDGTRRESAGRILRWLYDNMDLDAPIITDSLDDRYLAYLSPFYMLAAQAALTYGNFPADAPPSYPHAIHFPQAGLWVVETEALKLVANFHKGGVFHLNFGDFGTFVEVDSGYFGEIPDGQIVTTQYLNPEAEVSVDDFRARISTALVVNRPVTISPWKNIAVRAFNLITPGFGRRLFLDFLRNRAVSAGHTVGKVLREIVVEEDSVLVTDHINVNEPVLNLVLQLDTERAFSFASTGFFELQELGAGSSLMPIELAGGKVTIRRRYLPDGVMEMEQ